MRSARLARELDDPVGDLRLRLADELLDRLLELAREPLGRLLARLLDLRVEAALGLLGEARGSPVERLLELSELAPLGLGLPGDDARARLGLLAVDLLPELALAAPEALARPRGARGAARRRAPRSRRVPPRRTGVMSRSNSDAELGECLPLLLARGGEPLGVGMQARVVLVQGLLLALAEPARAAPRARAGRGRGRRPRPSAASRAAPARRRPPRSAPMRACSAWRAIASRRSSASCTLLLARARGSPRRARARASARAPARRSSACWSR